MFDKIQMILMMKTSLSNNELWLDIKKTTRSSEDFGDKNCAERISVRLGFKKLEKMKDWNINVRVNVTSVLAAGKYIFNFINEQTRLMLWILSLQKQPLEVFYKNVFLKISQNLQKNTCFRVHYSIKLQVSVLQFSLKKDPGVFSWEFCEIFKNMYFIEHLLVHASIILIHMLIDDVLGFL